VELLYSSMNDFNIISTSFHHSSSGLWKWKLLDATRCAAISDAGRSWAFEYCILRL